MGSRHKIIRAYSSAKGSSGAATKRVTAKRHARAPSGLDAMRSITLAVEFYSVRRRRYFHAQVLG